MTLFDEYQKLARSPTLSTKDLQRFSEIVEYAEQDEKLFTAIMNLEYLLAQEAGLFKDENIKMYLEGIATLEQKMEREKVFCQKDIAPFPGIPCVLR
jgi:hypothetical protein